jgi:hypothetical protein
VSIARIVVVVEGGLIQDAYSDTDIDVELVVVDYDAREFGQQGDDRVSSVEGREAWISGQPLATNAVFTEKVYAAW